MKRFVFLALFLCSAMYGRPAAAACTVKGTVQDCIFQLDWQWPGDPKTADGFVYQRQDAGNWVDKGTNPIDQLTAADGITNDPGNTQFCYRVFAFNSAGRSDPSNTACATTPIIDVVTMKTGAIVTVSHRSNDTSSIISILVNQNTVIGAGGLELTYPAKYTLLVSRRATNVSTVIALLVNKSTNVLINP